MGMLDNVSRFQLNTYKEPDSSVGLEGPVQTPQSDTSQGGSKAKVPRKIIALFIIVVLAVVSLIALRSMLSRKLVEDEDFIPDLSVTPNTFEYSGLSFVMDEDSFNRKAGVSVEVVPGFDDTSITPLYSFKMTIIPTEKSDEPLIVRKPLDVRVNLAESSISSKLQRCGFTQTSVNLYTYDEANRTYIPLSFSLNNETGVLNTNFAYLGAPQTDGSFITYIVLAGPLTENADCALFEPPSELIVL